MALINRVNLVPNAVKLADVRVAAAGLDRIGTGNRALAQAAPATPSHHPVPETPPFMPEPGAAYSGGRRAGRPGGFTGSLSASRSPLSCLLQSGQPAGGWQQGTKTVSPTTTRTGSTRTGRTESADRLAGRSDADRLPDLSTAWRKPARKPQVEVTAVLASRLTTAAAFGTPTAPVGGSGVR